MTLRFSGPLSEHQRREIDALVLDRVRCLQPRNQTRAEIYWSLRCESTDSHVFQALARLVETGWITRVIERDRETGQRRPYYRPASTH